jgi:FtsH-binding integral membrane protein
MNNLDYLESGLGATSKAAKARQNEKRENENDDAPLLDEVPLRLGFIRKVLGLLAIQLSITVAVCFIALIFPPYKEWLLTGRYTLIAALIGAITVGLTLVCCNEVAREVPTNYILLLVFTICEAYLVSYACVKTSPRVVIMAGALTIAMTISLFIYAVTTDTDFTMAGGTLFVLGAALSLFAIFLFFIKSPFLETLYSVLGVLLYGFYLIYDIQLLVGKGKNRLSYDDYIVGSLQIYIDIIFIFIQLLKLLTGDKE